MVPKVLLLFVAFAFSLLTNVSQAQPPVPNPVTRGEFDSLKKDFAMMLEEQLNQGRRLEQILRRDVNGDEYLVFKLESPAAKEEFQRAVQSAAPSHGELVIRNRMPSNQNLLVNGEQHQVLAGGILRVRVPRGMVSTQLSRQEPVHWNIGAPDYLQSIDIRPRETRSTATSWVTSRPIETVQPVQANPWPWNRVILVR